MIYQAELLKAALVNKYRDTTVTEHQVELLKAALAINDRYITPRCRALEGGISD